MSEKILCGPCGYAENNKNAEQWCTVCEEGLCADCEKVHKSIKTSRNHWLISIEDFRQIQNITISLNCKDHDKRLELYCKTHDVAVCLACVPSRHITCSDVIPLDKAAENAKHSTALADLENTLTRTIQNLQHIISDRESALDNFETQKQTIKNTITDTRAIILKKIDDLEQKLLHELDTIHDNCKSETNTLLNQSKNAKRDFNCLREQTSQLKSFASKIQLFLGTRQINEAVFKKVESVKEGIKSVHNFEVHLQLNTTIISLLDEEEQLGSLTVRKIATSIPFKEAKAGEAQLQLRVQNTKSIISIRIQLKKRFSVKHEGHKTILNGSTMLPNGKVLVASSSLEKNVILEYSEDGKYIRDIPFSGFQFDLTVIDTDRIAVTYGINT
ncbi:E3 ubiquitin-protein ligase TRIM45-like [Mytilus edulis]|uniref:E3 ubiquitin-protein ligase TRIM45-like n=1 Tax=Mytilus edulis TaxID=6550 RepID=UPI0039F0F5E7